MMGAASLDGIWVRADEDETVVANAQSRAVRNHRYKLHGTRAQSRSGSSSLYNTNASPAEEELYTVEF